MPARLDSRQASGKGPHLKQDFQEQAMKLINLSPKQLKLVLNIYPPYFGTGIKVEHISEDWRELKVSMRLRWYNRNAVGTHFGGSLYAMIDPHLMLLLMRLLGKEYLVWDQRARVEFIKASKGKVWAVFKITEDDIREIKRNTQKGEKYLASFPVEIRDEENELVARSVKVIYIRKNNIQHNFLSGDYRRES